MVDGVDGWMSSEQIARLYGAVLRCNAGDQVVEIGSYRGRSTIVLASAAADGVAIVAIDPHAGTDRGPDEIAGFEAEADADHDVFIANLTAADVADRVHHLREFSDSALAEVSGAVTVLFVDGAHRYAPARSDIHRWGARVDAGGTLLVHDSFSSVGVTLAIGRELLLGRRFRYVGRTRSLAEYRADLGAGWRSRTLNALRQTAQMPWFAKNLSLKVLLRLGLGGAVARLTGRRPEWPY